MACPPKYRAMNSFWRYYSGEKVAPVLTIFIGGNHEASNHNLELYYGGWAAPNIYFLGFAGVVSVGGVRIGGLSGIYNRRHYHHGHFEAPPFSDDDMRSVYHVRELEVVRLLALRRPIDVLRLTTGRSTWRATATCRASSAASPSCRASSRAARSARRRRRSCCTSCSRRSGSRRTSTSSSPPSCSTTSTGTRSSTTRTSARRSGRAARASRASSPSTSACPTATSSSSSRSTATARRPCSSTTRMDRRAERRGVPAGSTPPRSRRRAAGAPIFAHRRRGRRRGVRGQRPHGARQLCDHGAAAPRDPRRSLLVESPQTAAFVATLGSRRLPHQGGPPRAAAAAAATAAAAGGPAAAARRPSRAPSCSTARRSSWATIRASARLPPFYVI